MDMILSGATSFFSIFGLGFIAGSMFSILIHQVTEWVKHREQSHKENLRQIEVPHNYKD